MIKLANTQLLTVAHYPFDCTGFGPLRAMAWSGIRSPSDAEWITPDGDPNRDYYSLLLQHILGALASDTYLTNRWPHMVSAGITSYGLNHPSTAHWVKSRRFLPWQNSWLGWATQLLARRGYGPTANAVRDWVLSFPIDLYTSQNDPSQQYVDPQGQVWSFNPYDSQAYYLAIDQAPQMHACMSHFPLSMTNQDDPNQYMVGGFTPVMTYGEMYYWSKVGKAHEGYPMPEWCPADGQDWNPWNGGTAPLSTYNWHDYGGNPATAAAAEAVMDSNPATQSTQLTKALEALSINEAFYPPHGFSYIPTDPN